MLLFVFPSGTLNVLAVPSCVYVSDLVVAIVHAFVDDVYTNVRARLIVF
jgi:hypothetical protein